MWGIHEASEALRASNAFERVELETEAGPTSISAASCGQRIRFERIAQGVDRKRLRQDTAFLIRTPDDWDSFREARRIVALDMHPTVPSVEGKSVALLMLRHREEIEGRSYPSYELETSEALTAGEDVCIRVRRSTEPKRGRSGSSSTSEANFIMVELEGKPRQVRFLDEHGAEIAATPWPAHSTAEQIALVEKPSQPPKPAATAVRLLLQRPLARGEDSDRHPEIFIAHTPAELTLLWQSLGAPATSLQVDFATQSVVALSLAPPPSSEPAQVLQLEEVKSWDNVMWLGFQSTYSNRDSASARPPFFILAVQGKPEVVYFAIGGFVAAEKRRAATAR